VSRTNRGILVLDMSYTLAMFRERQMVQALDSRDAGGFFDTVLSVHPLAGLFESGDARYGPPRVTELGDRKHFVEGKIGRYRWPVILAPLNFILAQAALMRLLRRMGRDAHVRVVRVGDPYYLGLMGWLLARLLDVPLAIRVPFRYDEIRRLTGRATMPRLFRFRWIEERIERFVFPRCDLIAGANEDNMRYALDKGGRPDVATVFRYGNLLHSDHWIEPPCRPNADADLAQLGLTGERFVATVARLEPMKRVEDVVRVVAALSRRGTAVRGLIVGDGTLRQQLAQLARSLGVEHAIVFAGNRDQQWIARVLPRAASIVSPHMGRALVEAALSGVPIVAYDYDWQREVVTDGETGFLVSNGDWMAMTARTEELLADPSLARRMGDGARQRVAAMMNPEALRQHERATYARLIERWANRR
jgi:glycosyltransferase involved in cell wall biosynthesis